VTANFYRVGSSAPRPTPNLEDQGISLSLAPPSKPVRHGWPYQQLCCRRHSFIVHWYTSPLTQQQRAFDKVEIPLRGKISVTVFISSILSELYYKTFIPFYCWYGPNSIRVYVGFFFIKFYLNCDVINLIAV
jgi:hypothetical protein